MKSTVPVTVRRPATAWNMFDLVPRSWGGDHQRNYSTYIENRSRRPPMLMESSRWQTKVKGCHPLSKYIDVALVTAVLLSAPLFSIHAFLSPTIRCTGSLYSLSCLRLIRTLGSELFSPARFRLFSPLCSLQAIMSSLPPSPRVYLCSVCCCVCVISPEYQCSREGNIS